MKHQVVGWINDFNTHNPISLALNPTSSLEESKNQTVIIQEYEVGTNPAYEKALSQKQNNTVCLFLERLTSIDISNLDGYKTLLQDEGFEYLLT